MKHRIEVSDSDLARFCGPWSVSRKTVDVLLCESEYRNATAEQSAARYVRKYLDSIRAFVAECEAKLPGYEDLPFWRDAVAFWDQIAALADPEPASAPVADPEPSGEAFAQFLSNLLANEPRATNKVTARVIVSDETLRSLLVSALEGGSNYWYMHTRNELPAGVALADFEDGGGFANPEWSYFYLVPFIEGGALIFTTEAAGDEGDTTERRLDRAALAKGIQIMAEKYPRHFANVVSDDADAETGDVFLQCCLLGETVYG